MAHELSTHSLLKLISFIWWCGLYILSYLNIPNKSPEWHSRAVTLLHGSVGTLVGLSQCKFNKMSVSQLTSKCMKRHYALMIWSWGYFAFDLLWCLVYMSEGPLMLCHHTSALVAITVYMQKENTGCTFACTVALLEITNPLLQTRWFLRNEGYEKTAAYKIVEILYLVMFLSMRGVLGSYILYKVLPNKSIDIEEKIICLVFYLVSVGFIIDILGFVAHKYKDYVGKCQVFLNRHGYGISSSDMNE